MESKNLVRVIVALTLVSLCSGTAESSAKEGRIIGECLESYGGLTLENAERLHRYKQWSETYEEIPCFTSCYLSKMYDFYDENRGFDPRGVIQHFGQTLFDTCRNRLRQGRSSCDHAYDGFHCLVSLENDPFVLIESMDKLDTEAKTAMKDCLRRFDQFEWQRLSDYSAFPVREPIPCFTKCFLDRLQLFGERAKQWNLVGMRHKLGVPADGANYRHCLTRSRSRNSCAWMYNEFTCFVMAGRPN